VCAKADGRDLFIGIRWYPCIDVPEFIEFKADARELQFGGDKFGKVFLFFRRWVVGGKRICLCINGGVPHESFAGRRESTLIKEHRFGFGSNVNENECLKSLDERNVKNGKMREL